MAHELAAEVARVHRLEAADVLTGFEAADLIAQLTDGKRTVVHALARLPLIDLQARFLQLLDANERSMHDDIRQVLLPFTRDHVVAAILDRVS